MNNSELENMLDDNESSKENVIGDLLNYIEDLKEEIEQAEKNIDEKEGV